MLMNHSLSHLADFTNKTPLLLKIFVYNFGEGYSGYPIQGVRQICITQASRACSDLASDHHVPQVDKLVNIYSLTDKLDSFGCR